MMRVMILSAPGLLALRQEASVAIHEQPVTIVVQAGGREHGAPEVDAPGGLQRVDVQ